MSAVLTYMQTNHLLCQLKECRYMFVLIETSNHMEVLQGKCYMASAGSSPATILKGLGLQFSV